MIRGASAMRNALRRCVAGPAPRRALSSAAAVDDRLLASLEAVCDTSTNASILARHGKDESHHACVCAETNHWFGWS
jgi:hypothetical protein